MRAYMGVSPFVSPKRKLVIFLWFGSAAPRFPELHAGLVAIGELDADFFESSFIGFHVIDESGRRALACFHPSQRWHETVGALKVKEFPGLQRIDPETIEKH